MAIRALPALLVNQIAAGEVIERPASVVKELVENSLDAGAGRIEVTIEAGGKELIRVADDGAGIDEAELPLAVAPHATSKIARAEDLDRIATMGFRGEALASIASVSRLRIVSRRQDRPAAASLEAEGSRVGEVKPCGGPAGTSVSVRNLFFNTPARRKFLKTEATEASRIASTVEALAMAHPRVGFTLTHGERRTLDLLPREGPRERVVDLLGEELESELIEVSRDGRGVSIWGMAGRPSIARSNANRMHLYLNGRPIRDRSLHHALKEAYRGLIDPTRHPTLVLFLEMDPGQVDVNVHPTKAEVRFRDAGRVHGAVLSAVREALRGADLVPSVAFGGNGRGLAWSTPGAADGAGRRSGGGATLRPEFGSGLGGAGVGGHGGSGGSGGSVEVPAATGAKAFVEYFKRLDPSQKGFVYREVKEALGAGEGDEEAGREAAGVRSAGTREEVEAKGAAADLPGARLSPAMRALQVHSSYIVTQDEEGLLIIDQHALHERVMFEGLKDRIARGALESQRLLMPETVAATRVELERLERLRPLLSRIGVEAEPLGPGTIGVHAFPSFLFERGVGVNEFLKELLERAGEEDLESDLEAALHEVLDMMACKAAVKAGDRLSTEELEELLKHRERVERASNCPHGRPTTLRLSLRDLEKQFGRR